MILPDFKIRELVVGDGRHVLEPWSERTVQNGMSYGLSCAGYDIRTKQGVVLPPGGFSLLSSIEHFHMPDDVIGIVHDKSTWARRGLAAQNTVIESGWIGWLTLEVSNHSPDVIEIRAGDPIAQILFHQMAAPPEQVYRGKYHNQADRPVGAISEEVST